MQIQTEIADIKGGKTPQLADTTSTPTFLNRWWPEEAQNTNLKTINTPDATTTHTSQSSADLEITVSNNQDTEKLANTAAKQPVQSINRQPNPKLNTAIQQQGEDSLVYFNEKQSSGTTSHASFIKGSEMPVTDRRQQINGIQVVLNVNESTSGATRLVADEMLSRHVNNTLLSQVAEVIRHNARKDARGQTQVTLQLHPQNLGKVIIKLTYRDGNISTHFYAATEPVKRIIESFLPQLRENLASFELNLQNASVSVGEDSGLWGQQGNRQSQFKRQRNSYINVAEKSDETLSAKTAGSIDRIDANRFNYFV